MERLDFDKNKILTVNIEKVKPNPWNPKDGDTEEFEKIKKGITKKGQKLPVVVRQVKGMEEYEIVDGEQRYKACKELGFSQIIIYNEGFISDQEAKELTLWYEVHVPFNEVSLAFMVKEMNDLYEELELPFNDLEFDNLLKIAEMDWNKFDEADSDVKDNEENEPTFEKLTISITLEQKEVINSAIKRVKNDTGDWQISDGRCIELICADYLAG